MITKTSTTQAAKRKKTMEMPDSPPKRVTRARAKAPDDPQPKPKLTRITTASAKTIAEKKKAAVPTKAVKRKTRADDEDVVQGEKPMSAEQPEPEVESMRTKSHQKKAALGDKAGEKDLNVPKPRGRQPRTLPAAAAKQEAPKPRGRPKKIVEPTPTPTPSADAEEQVENLEPVKKTTRGRPAANTTKLSTTASVTKVRVAPMKKVKFQQDEPDKENIPIEADAPKKSAMKATGLKAKPVRKPAGARAATRSRKVTEEVDGTRETKEDKSLPLSPKKVTQVAKSSSISSEDELSGEKSPIRALSRSPIKGPASPIRDVGSVSKLDYNQDTPPSSPSNPIFSSILASPARKPPPSPFKDGLKNSPRKVNLGDSIAQPVLLSSRTPMKASLLQASPRRGIIGESALKPALHTTQSPFKASLLQSPARRPLASPMKVTGSLSPGKSSMTLPVLDATSASKQNSPIKASKPSPQKAISSPLRAARSPGHAFKVHKMTDEEREMEAGKNDMIPSQPTSPIKQRIAVVSEPGLPVPEKIEETSIETEGVSLSPQIESPAADGITVESPAHSDHIPYDLNPAFSVAAAAWRRVSTESMSEDELASPQKGYDITPLKRFAVSSNDFGTPAFIGGSGNIDASECKISMTPLADQLNSWAASTPIKQNAVARPRQARGMFSFGGAEILAGLENTSFAAAGSPAKSSYFEDEMAIRDAPEAISCDELVNDNKQECASLQASFESQASEEYGDENAIPAELEALRLEQEAQDDTLTCTPAKVFTPAKLVSQQPREIHTVSKVPLRPSAEDSPLRVTRQRSRSFGGPLAVVGEPEAVNGSRANIFKQSQPLSSVEDEIWLGDQPATPVIRAATVPQTPSSNMKLDAETPGRTVRKGVVPDVLKGAIVYVDVHTTEGADASGIFVDLLTQMGARCVKQWSWNPRASMGVSLDSNGSSQGDSPDRSPSACKIGITHVVFKDGGKRTLEKVRSSNGVVSCVGVGWVLE